MKDVGTQNFHSQHAPIKFAPQMPVLADCVLLGQGSLSVRVHPRALQVMAGSAPMGQSEVGAAIEPRLAFDGQ